MTHTEPEPVDRIPLAHSVRYVARGLPELPYQYGRGTLVPSEITLTYRAAPDSQLGRVHAYVAGRIHVDGQEIPHGPYGQHYHEGLENWPAWLSEEARLHDPDAVSAGQAPAADQSAEAVCMCGHLMSWHHEDVCLLEGCGCNDGREPEEPTTPSHRAGLRDDIAAALAEARRPGLGGMTEAEAVGRMADAVLPVLYREWPWLRAEAEDSSSGCLEPAAASSREPASGLNFADQTVLRDRIAAVLRAHASLGGAPLRWELPHFDGATPSLPRISGWRPLDEVVDAVLAVLPAPGPSAADWGALCREGGRLRKEAAELVDRAEHIEGEVQRLGDVRAAALSEAETRSSDQPEWARPETEEEKIAKARRMAKALCAPPVAPAEWATTTKWPLRHKRYRDRRVHATASFAVNGVQQIWSACEKRVGDGGYPVSHLSVDCRDCKRAIAEGEARGKELITTQEAEAELRRLAGEPHTTTPHACDNCEGIDPDTCWTNPNRPPEPCPAAEFEDYGQQCTKPVGHELHSFEEPAAVVQAAAPDTTPCGPAPSQCDAETGEPCTDHEREQAHAEGEHCFCGPECAEADRG